MITLKVDGLRNCKICGSHNVILQRNASKAFQVKCKDCGNRTKWKRKIEAVIDWFNN